ncbi:hypothetical protein CYMTET_52219 [Cymbomonas tetramitiformis]|uniref:Uncharacterized protein n=1 Tax=Cymbomonas tetramitiformis TaxID=36881 RepID=A0AAE0ERV4_9CHLO|nr:hypothetical protein CYMTET_52219 [Cymbomonas tetramitiformis]
MKGQWDPVQVAEHLGLEPVYLAVPAARLYLRELYFGQETELKAGQEAARQSFGDLKCWKRLRECKWKGRKIWRCPTRAKLYTGASLYSWGGLLNLKLEARGFWCDELRHLLHITRL